MTEKRFEVTFNDSDFHLKDNETGEELKLVDERDTFDYVSDVCGLLNELHEENQALHKTIEELDNCQKGQSHRINDLYLENKQLKDLIIHLGYTIKYDGYRHISLELKR